MLTQGEDSGPRGLRVPTPVLALLARSYPKRSFCSVSDSQYIILKTSCMKLGQDVFFRIILKIQRAPLWCTEKETGVYAYTLYPRNSLAPLGPVVIIYFRYTVILTFYNEHICSWSSTLDIFSGFKCSLLLLVLSAQTP